MPQMPTTGTNRPATKTDSVAQSTSVGGAGAEASLSSPDLTHSEEIAQATSPSSEILWGYFLLSYAALLINTRGFLRHIEHADLWLMTYATAVQIVYTLLYLSPVVVAVLVVHRGLHIGILRRKLGLRDVTIRRILYAVAIVGCALVQYILFADKSVFDVFGFHLNGFVWNLVMTPGGIESMGAGPGTTWLAVLVGVGLLVGHALLLLLVHRIGRVRRLLRRGYHRKPIIIGVCAFIVAALYAQLGYGISTFHSYGPTLAVANAFPGFFPSTFTKLATSMGYEVQRTPTMAVDSDATGLRYPLHEIRLDKTVQPPNIVWLVSESLRADMLDPEIMPHAWALSEKSSRFEHHYSGGNGTRMGMFSMFYGLYGPYWFPFLAEHRGPVLVDTLLDLDYQLGLYTSAMFTYPEFNKTVFSRIPSDQLHQGGMKPAWRQDQRHINSILRFIDQRDKSKPFMTFLFFESPHANYSFSKKAIIRQPYAEEFNYVSMNLERDIGLIKNRYINACHQIDISIGRVLDYLHTHDLIDSTIVILTGDHGEAFMENGRWGHNSKFTDVQTRVPFVLWVPGRPARVVSRITSHLDIAATIMPLLGVLNPAEDYSQGYDLFGPKTRPYTVIAAWNNVAYVSEDFKATFPTSAFSMFQQTLTTADDEPLENRAAFYESHQKDMVEIMRGLKTFRK